MKGTFLEKILDAKQGRVAAAKGFSDPEALIHRALSVRTQSRPHRLREALSDPSRINVIAEFKRASPSKGTINVEANVADVARSYKRGGAAAISVLTEEDFFQGSLDDLRAIREAVDLPVLRKDFIFETYQVYEAAEAGADAILLIAAMLDNKALVELYHLAEDELGMDALIEVHTLEELELVKDIGVKTIGVNNRDLCTFNVSLDVSRELIGHASGDAVMIAESGLKKRADLLELKLLGYSGFLIGESLMRSDDPAGMLELLR